MRGESVHRTQGGPLRLQPLLQEVAQGEHRHHGQHGHHGHYGQHGQH